MADYPPDNRESFGIILARIEERVNALAISVASLEKKIDAHYVTYNEFTPVRNLVYGCVALFLTGIIGGLIALILKTK